MAMSNPVQIFGICRAVIYDTKTREFFGPPIRVLNSSSFSSDKELIENVGGCSAYPYSVATGRSSAEGSLSFAEISPWMLAKMAGGSVVINGAEVGGNVSALANVVGSSMDDATDGIAITAKTGSESNLEFGQYRVVAKTSSTVDVFASKSNSADSLLIAGDIDVTASPDLSAYGLEVTENGTADLVVGDVAMFDVRPINSGSSISIVGGSTDITPEVGVILYAPNQDGNLVEIDVYRVKFAGLPLGLTSNEFQSFEASFKAFYDATRDGVFSQKLLSGVI